MHRIMTNGVLFRVETKNGNKWDIEIESDFGSMRDRHFKSYAKAVKWIQVQYGKTADIKSREWKPA